MATTQIGDTPIVVINEEIDIPDDEVFARLQEEFGDSIDYVTNNFIINIAYMLKKSDDGENWCHITIRLQMVDGD